MATITLPVGPYFPEGAAVGAHERNQWGANIVAGAPRGDAADTGVVLDGELEFTGLEENIPYVAFATVGGTLRHVGFLITADPDSSGGGGGGGSSQATSSLVFPRLEVFGHSYAAGEAGGFGDLEGPGMGLAGLLANAIGADLENHAVGGSHASLAENQPGGYARVLQRLKGMVPAQRPYEVSTNGAVLLVYGINDLISLEENSLPFINSMRVMISRILSAAVFEDSHASWDFSGGSEETPARLQHSGDTVWEIVDNGDTATWTAPDDMTPGSTVAFGFTIDSGDAGQAAFAVNGVPAGTLNLDSNGQTNVPPHSSPHLKRLVGLDAEDEVQITFSAITNKVQVDYAQIESPVEVAPLPIVMDIPSLPGGDDLPSLWNLSLRQMINEFPDGAVAYVRADDALAAEDGLFSIDNLHLNSHGNAVAIGAVLEALADADLNPTRMAAIAAGSSQKWTSPTFGSGFGSKLGFGFVNTNPVGCRKVGGRVELRGLMYRETDPWEPNLSPIFLPPSFRPNGGGFPANKPRGPFIVATSTGSAKILIYPQNGQVQYLGPVSGANPAAGGSAVDGGAWVGLDGVSFDAAP